MEQYIDLKFKDSKPVDTVNKIKNILKDLGISVKEYWNESGVENCCSVNIRTEAGFPSTNGKGITPELALASGYAEFIERIQSGIYLTSYQSIHRDDKMNLHTYAPDGKYFSVEEMVENGQWMDAVIDTYKESNLTRQSIAEYCQSLSLRDDGKVLMIPFYSLFEDKYVYFPAIYIARMYSANGNCAGNTREEAWVHALSEMMERYACQKMLLSGQAAPRIAEETLQKFPTVSKILKQVREDGNYDITVFDYSIGNGFPVISTRIINKNNQDYHVNVAADPVLEIAIQRTLTETFQGRQLNCKFSRHDGRVLNKITDYPLESNVKNQLQSSDGIYTADYFADEISCTKSPAVFDDNSKKSNKELLAYMLDLYRKLGKPVYVRNYSYLGFQSYKFIVPGFSETNALDYGRGISSYAIGDSVHNIFRNPVAASNEDLEWLLQYTESTSTFFGRYYVYSVNSGIPMFGFPNKTLSTVVRAYSAYRLGRYSEALKYNDSLISQYCDDCDVFYFKCIKKYLTMKKSGISEDKIRSILYKFFRAEYPDRLYALLDRGESPYEPYIIRCDLHSCDVCKYQKYCCYHTLGDITAKVGARYSKFTEGQDRSVFRVE